MRPAIALLLLALPAGALAQPAAPPTNKPASSQARPAKVTPKPNAAAHPPAKPTHAAPKPSQRPAAKPAQAAHPAAPKPAPPPVAPPIAETPAEPPKGSVTGLPLPRFAALRSDDINFRTGPGTRYPIEWVYKRRDLPVAIEREFETWRLVRDQEGTQGWVQQAMLVGRRTAIVTGAERTLRAEASPTAAAVAKLKPGVILRLRSCDATSDWCQAASGDYRGWILRSEVWGVMPGEAIQ